jgi:hypothetical protein
VKLRPVRRPLVDGQLLPQGEVLEGELAVAAEDEGEESEQMEQQSDHRAEILSGSAPTDQRLGRGRILAKDREVTAHDNARLTQNVSRRATPTLAPLINLSTLNSKLFVLTSPPEAGQALNSSTTVFRDRGIADQVWMGSWWQRSP